MKIITEQQIDLLYLAHTIKLRKEIAVVAKEVCDLTKRVKKLQKIMK